MQRIAKWIANCGVCSRREAERLIAEGLVTYRGKVVETPALSLDDPEQVLVRGVALRTQEAVRVWAFYKPRGVVTTRDDPEGRPHIYSYVPQDLGHVMKIGRLDIESEGLILFTNNGDYARQMELPEAALERKYRVRVYGVVPPRLVKVLKDGIIIEGVHYRSVQVIIQKQQDNQAWLLVTLIEGKNREIRRIMNYFGLRVSRLIRIAYGPYDIGSLTAGEWREVACVEI